MERKIPKLVISLGSLKSQNSEESSSSIIPIHCLPVDSKFQNDKDAEMTSIPSILLRVSSFCFVSLSESLEKMPTLGMVERKRLLLSKLAEQLSLWQKVSCLLSWSRILSRFPAIKSTCANIEKSISERNRYQFELQNIFTSLLTKRFPLSKFESAFEMIEGDVNSNLLKTLGSANSDPFIISLTLGYASSALRNIPEGFLVEKMGHRLLVSNSNIKLEFKVGPSQSDPQIILCYLTDVILTGSHRLLSDLTRKLLPKISSTGKTCWDVDALVELIKRVIARLLVEFIIEHISDLATHCALRFKIKSAEPMNLKISLTNGLYEQTYSVENNIVDSSSADLKFSAMKLFSQYIDNLIDNIANSILNSICSRFPNALLEGRVIKWTLYGMKFVLAVAINGYHVTCCESGAFRYFPAKWSEAEEIYNLSDSFEIFIIENVGTSLSKTLQTVLGYPAFYEKTSNEDYFEFKFSDIPKLNMIINFPKGEISFSGGDSFILKDTDCFSTFHDFDTFIQSNIDIINQFLIRESIKIQGLILVRDYEDVSMDVVVNAPIIYPCYQISIKIEGNSIKICRLEEENDGSVKSVWTDSSISKLLNCLLVS